MKERNGAWTGLKARLCAVFVSAASKRPRCRSPPPSFDFLSFQKSENGGNTYAVESRRSVKMGDLVDSPFLNSSCS